MEPKKISQSLLLDLLKYLTFWETVQSKYCIMNINIKLLIKRIGMLTIGL